MAKLVVITTGGTGGHIFPALAVAEELKESYSDLDLLFIGGSYGQESRLARKAGLNFLSLPAKGVLGKGFKSISSLVWLSLSLCKCILYYKKYRPKAVLGFGGYAGFVPVLAACWMKIPAAIHEQNSQPGMSNRVLGKKVEQVFLSFPDEQRYFEESKTVLTGNPVRRNLIELGQNGKSYQEPLKKNLLIIGGSQGATALNRAIVNCLPALQEMSVHLIHQTGEKDYAWVKQEYAEMGLDEQSVQPFIDDMFKAYKWSDLVICRAGASTLAELTVVGRPSILVPYPYAVHKHQLSNAKAMERAGAAICLEQSYIEQVNLSRMVEDLLALPSKLQAMSRAAKRMGKPRACKEIAERVVEMAK